MRFPRATRLVRSIKDECLSRVIPFGERHLRRMMVEYVEHYHRERNHQGTREQPNRRRASHQPRRPDSSASAARRLTQLLRTSRVNEVTT